MPPQLVIHHSRRRASGILGGARWNFGQHGAMTVLVVVAVVLHCCTAVRRADGLLEHDEAISLLAAAGKSQRINALYEAMDGLQLYRAGDLRDLLRPTPDVTTVDVVRSLGKQDIHPPMYFLVLHGLSGLWADHPACLRMIGSLLFLVTAWVANRWIWPAASPAAKWLGAAWLLTTPAMMDVATELRQYAAVYLAVVISIAALVLLWEESKPVRHTVLLLTLAPVLLLWLQWGTVVWVAVGFLTAVAQLAVTRFRRWKVLLGAALAALLLLAPLLFWSRHALISLEGPAPVPLDNAVAGALLPLSGSLANSWIATPWTWNPSSASLAAAILVLTISLLLIWRQAKGADLAIWSGGVAWGVAWAILLARGLIPSHAVEPKQLAPLLLMPVCLLVRASAAAHRKPIRWCSTAVLTVMLISLWVRAGLLLSDDKDAALVGALRNAETMLVDAPRRGYLLPLTDKMGPESQVVIVSPAVAAARWEQLASLLPGDRLLLAEIDTRTGEQRSPEARMLFERLSRLYRQAVPLRKGPRRTVTEFRHRLAANPVEREETDG